MIFLKDLFDGIEIQNQFENNKACEICFEVCNRRKEM